MKPRAPSIDFAVKREAGSWRIDDIRSAGQPSLRSYFRTNFGG